MFNSYRCSIFCFTFQFPNVYCLPAKCPPGFTSEDGMTNCKPCGRDKYWVNATNCEDCPAGSKTDVMNGVPDIEGCKGMSEMNRKNILQKY